jgi:hypothetical protein
MKLQKTFRRAKRNSREAALRKLSPTALLVLRILDDAAKAGEAALTEDQIAERFDTALAEITASANGTMQ